MTRAWGGEIAVTALLREGVTCMFGMTGGHLQPLQDFAYRAGIDVYQVRHEQAGVHAADAFARITRKPGVCFGTAGPGMLNMATAIHMAYLAHSPIVCLLGGHKTKETDRGSLQEAHAESILSSVTKWTRRCHDVDQASYYIRKAFRDATTPPYGPVALEFPLDSFNTDRTDPADQVAYLAGPWLESDRPALPPDPKLMDVAAAHLAASRRPIIIAGDDVHWDRASTALTAVAEQLRMPVSVRRLARGAVAENSDVVIPAAVRKGLIRDADVVVLLGLDVGYFESFGNWTTQAKFLQVNRNPGQIATHLPTLVELQADSRSFLDALLARAKDFDTATQTRREWMDRVVGERRENRRRRGAVVSEQDATRPIHPGTLARSLAAQWPAGRPVVLDSFTGSAFLSDEIELTNSGQMLDSGLSAAVGHGVGMGVGASIATAEGPVLVLMGDGGMGIGGGDIETAMRLSLPVIYVIYNNSALCAGLEQYCYGKDFRVLGPKARGGFNLTQDVRYDQMYAPLGCHVENIEEPHQLAGVINRAIASGTTSVINVVGTKDVRHPLYDSAYCKEVFWHLPAAEVEPPVRERHIQRHE
ncbi:MAG: hypothetical protein GEV28_23485 [Actinophytocola sp.]|uniref:thiamine pyrophosphate-binding protein n=1 Tax=Actinophytocola sp. TaxID=1872138 RepID=UPI00132741B2|nr:thiamine pyrophosphate-binding protein [Actinophytocola sp.]MPZ83192.1 hypothetical protein [Actinophytocola sp.]